MLVALVHEQRPMVTAVQPAVTLVMLAVVLEKVPPHADGDHPRDVVHGQRSDDWQVGSGTNEEWSLAGG